MTDHPPSPPPHKAGLWTRMVARNIDLVLYSFLLSLPIYSLFHALERLFPSLAALNGPTYGVTPGLLINTGIDLFFVFPLSMLLDALICARFSNTLGKHLLGIKHFREDGRTLDLPTCLHRNYLIYVGCFMGGIYLLPPVAEIFHYIRYRRTGTTFWDHEEGTVVLSLKGSNHRTVLMTCLWLVMSAATSMAAGRFLLHRTISHLL